MKQRLFCSNCGADIEATFEVEIKDKRAVGTWTFEKGVRFSGETQMIVCGNCNLKASDAE